MCSDRLVIPQLGVDEALKPNGTTVIEFTAPDRPGTYTMTCQMGMMQGTVRLTPVGAPVGQPASPASPAMIAAILAAGALGIGFLIGRRRTPRTTDGKTIEKKKGAPQGAPEAMRPAVFFGLTKNELTLAVTVVAIAITVGTVLGSRTLPSSPPTASAVPQEEQSAQQPAIPEQATTVDGEVQRINVQVGVGPTGYAPAIIRAKAGLPLEITFSQGWGCGQYIVIPDFNVNVDLSEGPKTIRLAALQPGEYRFMCGMDMMQGLIVAE